jgi:hypothetical protein
MAEKKRSCVVIEQVDEMLINELVEKSFDIESQSVESSYYEPKTSKSNLRPSKRDTSGSITKAVSFQKHEIREIVNQLPDRKKSNKN